jgi:hypothetical protein
VDGLDGYPTSKKETGLYREHEIPDKFQRRNHRTEIDQGGRWKMPDSPTGKKKDEKDNSLGSVGERVGSSGRPMTAGMAMTWRR